MTKKLHPFLAALAVAAVVFVPGARADDSQSGRHPVGSWFVEASPAAAASLMTFTQDGTVTASRPPVVLAGPSAEFVSTGHGTWTQKGNRDISSTVLYLRSSLAAEFTGTTRVVTTLKATDKANELTGTATVDILLANGNLVVSFQIPAKMTRVAAAP